MSFIQPDETVRPVRRIPVLYLYCTQFDYEVLSASALEYYRIAALWMYEIMGIFQFFFVWQAREYTYNIDLS
jgi:hypothetical protein